jgi:hypothetical protein
MNQPVGVPQKRKVLKLGSRGVAENDRGTTHGNGPTALLERGRSDIRVRDGDDPMARSVEISRGDRGAEGTTGDPSLERVSHSQGAAARNGVHPRCSYPRRVQGIWHG